MAHDESKEDELCVFGYGSKVYPRDEHLHRITEERHLCNWLDTDIRLDRFDVRMLLHSITDVQRDHFPRRSPSPDCPSEAMEEEMCETERYKDLHAAVEEARNERKRTEIAFNYDDKTAEVKKEVAANRSDDSGGSDSEAEPFEVPEGIKLPFGLECPQNQKLNHIILRTAGFVVEKGVQMEIVIKAKQRNNLEQFGFLEFDHPLNPYYKYMMKMIREKKYTVPDFDRQKRLKKKIKVQPTDNGANDKNKIKQEAKDDSSSSSGSESDYELHPLLMAARNKASEERTRNSRFSERNVQHSLEKEDNDFEVNSGNNMYASLFKNLAGLSEKPPEESRFSPKPQVVDQIVKETVVETRPATPDVEFQKWWSWFYSAPCPVIKPASIITPPPDLAQVIDNWAQYTAKHGAEGEKLLREHPTNSDGSSVPLKFLTSDSPFHSYYQQKVQAFQRSYGIYPAKFEATSSTMAEIEMSTPPPPMNRKQRRRLQDAPRVYAAVPIQVVDPITAGSNDSMPSPSQGAESTSVSLKFTPRKFDSPTTANAEGEPSTSQATDILIPPAPIPPSLQNDIQLERKEKARLFMEKILRDKQIKRKQEQKPDQKPNPSLPKLESNLAIVIESEVEAHDDASKNGDIDGDSSRRTHLIDPLRDKNSKDYIDNLISNKINTLLSSGVSKTDSKGPGHATETNDRGGHDKKHKKSSKKKRSRSRSRSRSHGRSKKRRRSRDRSRSRDRKNTHRHR